MGCLDYVAGWFMKAAGFGCHTLSAAAFVTTNSICQGQQVPFLWPHIFGVGQQIVFAHTSFKWSNLASHNAGVTVAVVGIAKHPASSRRLFVESANGDVISKDVENINAYLVAGENVIVKKAMSPLTEVSAMDFGNKADDGGHLTLTAPELEAMSLNSEDRSHFIKAFFGSKEFINGETRHCVWINDESLAKARSINPINSRIEMVRSIRLKSQEVAMHGVLQRVPINSNPPGWQPGTS